MGRVWLGAPQDTAGHPDAGPPPPFDRRADGATAAPARPLRAQPAQRHGQRDSAGRPRRWWQRVFRR